MGNSDPQNGSWFRWLRQAAARVPGILPGILLSLILFSSAAPEMPVAAADDELQIDGISLTEKDRRLYLRFTLKNGFPQQIVDIIQSGIPVSYNYEIGITKEGRFWNKDLVNIRLLKVLSFDNIRNQYLITVNYPDTRIINFRSLEAARKYVLNVEDLPLIWLSALEKGTSYTLKLKVEVKKKESKMPFYGLMKMFSSFKLETDWYEVQFNF